MKPSGYKTPQKAVQGLGAAHDGTHHFWMERVTALALVPLTIWFMINLATHLLAADRAMVAHWIAQPINAILLIIFLVLMFVHSRLGVQVIVEDYVHHEGKKLALLLLSSATHIILGTASVVAVAHLHLSGI